jgi:hypothetical protein
VADVCAELKLPLHSFAWQQGMRRAGLLPTALYLVRPDGYVALTDPQADPERLREYLRAGMVTRFVTPDERLAEQMEPVAAADRPYD